MPRGGFRPGSGKPKKGEIRIKKVLTRIPKELVVNICAFCGEEYRNKRRKYCSKAHCVAANTKKQKSFPHKCEKCGEDFTGKQSSRYCSGDCYRTASKRILKNGITEKRCPKCGEWKPSTDEYYHHSNITGDGFHGHCKECCTKRQRDYVKTDKAKELRKNNRLKNKDSVAAYRQRIKPVLNEKERERSRTDLRFSLNRRMRSLVYAGLKKNKEGRKWQDLVGYSIDDLRHHIEKRFKPGMTWDRFMSGDIHLDHKTPQSVFNFSSPNDIDFKKCWALRNLQPLWADDNLSKGAKIGKPFQPSLCIGG